MASESTPASNASVNRAKELTGELRKLQEQVESLDAGKLTENVAKVRGAGLLGRARTPGEHRLSLRTERARVQLNEHVSRITEKLHSTLALLNNPDAAGGPAAAPPTTAAAAAASAAAAGRHKIDKMSAEVVDSNPYSRLMALQRMGIVKDYERIRDKTVRALLVPCLWGVACSRCHRDAWARGTPLPPSVGLTWGPCGPRSGEYIRHALATGGL